jgi:beta-lactamase class A
MGAKYALWLLFWVGLGACQTAKQKPLAILAAQIEAELALVEGEFAVAYQHLGNPADSLYLNADTPMHAASTMKTPVMVEVYHQASLGKLSLQDSVLLKNEFASIVDGSPYRLDTADDSGQDLYHHLGERRTVRQLVYDMITYSSNLATNLLIDRVGAPQVVQTMKGLGIQNLQVLRGVEDQKAFDQGLNNTVTARGLAQLFALIARGQAVGKWASSDMEAILLDQKFKDIIPAQLPKEVKVAHKTGEIRGVRHDSGIVFLPTGEKYVLVLLSRKLADPDAGVRALAKVSALVYAHVAQK